MFVNVTSRPFIGRLNFFTIAGTTYANDNAQSGSEALAVVSVVESVVGVPAIVPLMGSSVSVVHVAVAPVVRISVVVPDSIVSDCVSHVLIVGAWTLAPI